jgi:hypothetical protein
MSAYVFHNAAATAYTRLTIWPGQRLYHYAVRLRPHRCPGLAAPAHTPHAGVLETALSRLSWHVFVVAGTSHCA